MKESRVEKLTARLQAVETQLRDGLLSVLPRAAEDGYGAFENSEFSPPALKHHMSQDAERFLDFARESLSLQEQLEVDMQSLANLYLSACEEFASSNPQRRGPRRLAKWLLAEARHGAQPAVQGDGPASGGSAP